MASNGQRPSARRAALHALLRVELGEGYSNLALDGVLRRAALSAEDTAFATALFYGVLERRITLDYYLRECVRGRLSPYVRECLRLGLYQILYMDKVPDSAAVNETVELVKASRENRAAGLCNAALRAASRKKEAWELPTGDSPEALSIRYACPPWLAQNLKGDYGEAAARGFLEDSLRTPPVYIRVNTLKTTCQALARDLEETGIAVRPAGLEDALGLTAPGGVENNPLYIRGLFHVQDLASQFCVALLDPQPGERILDLCAAPGGKSFTAAQRMEDRGQLVACDLHEGRAGLIRDGAKRLGLTCLRAGKNDGRIYDPALSGVWEEALPFDRVLCDAPCSGFGIIRRKPDIKYKDPDGLKALPGLQLSILENGSRYVRPGGRLVYSTCTLRRAENQKVCGRFLASHPEFSLEKGRADIRSACADDPDGMYTFMPQVHGSDGFFAAVFRRAD